MTEIDPKALEHACLCAGRSVHHFDRMGDDLPLRASIVAHARAIEREAATEARHAAELRELKERFSEAVVKAIDAGADEWIYDLLSPFIIAKPDPLVEIAREMTLLDGVVRTDNQKAAIREGRAGNTASEDFYDRLRAAMQARGYQVTKIGEAGE